MYARSRYHIWLVAFGLALGCSKAPTPAPSTSQPSSAVTNGEARSKSSPVLPPGDFELPPDGAQSTEPKPESSESSGIQLPPDVAPIPAPGPGATKTPDASSTKPLPIKFASWKEIEASVKTNGRVTIVDLWSLACAPCMKEYPGLVRLHKQYGDAIVCIGVSLDYDGRRTRPPQHYQSEVDEFLHSVQASFDNYISTTPSDDVYSMVDIPSIPAVLVFDAQGNLVRKFVDGGATAGFSYERDVAPLVSQLAG
jgi:thiol-disulfide isomerase/thioredoxin